MASFVLSLSMMNRSSPDTLDDPWRRGIFRSNARRLSISLAPLVAQRSLLFRINADLAGAERYSDVADLDEIPLLYSVTPSTTPQIESSKPTNVSSARSPLSVYSQDSWKHTSASLVTPNTSADRRRNAMAFSPTVQWDQFSSPAPPSGHLDFSNGLHHSKATTAPPSASSTPTPPSSARLKMNISSAMMPPVIQGNDDQATAERSILIGSVQVVDEPRPVVAVRLQVEDSCASPVLSMSMNHDTSSEENPVVSSTSNLPHRRTQSVDSTKKSKPFQLRKLISSHLCSKASSSVQGKAEDAAAAQATPSMRSRISSFIQLPELQLSPIQLAFDLLEELTPFERDPSPPLLPVVPPATQPPPTVSSDTAPSPSPPPMSIHQARPTTPTSFKRARRRTHSSPTVPRPSRRWNPADMPPLPPLPAFLGVSKQVIHTQPRTTTDMPPPPKSGVPLPLKRTPRPRPPRSARPPSLQCQTHLLDTADRESEEGDQPFYSSLRTKAEWWEEIIATTPVSASARPRGMSVSSYSMSTMAVGSSSTAALPPMVEHASQVLS